MKFFGLKKRVEELESTCETLLKTINFQQKTINQLLAITKFIQDNDLRNTFNDAKVIMTITKGIKQLQDDVIIALEAADNASLDALEVKQIQFDLVKLINAKEKSLDSISELPPIKIKDPGSN